jgi:hypothetical protein
MQRRRTIRIHVHVLPSAIREFGRVMHHGNHAVIASGFDVGVHAITLVGLARYAFHKFIMIVCRPWLWGREN